MKKIPLLITMTVLLTALILAIRGCRKNASDLRNTNEYLNATELNFKAFKTKSDLNAAMSNQKILSLESLLAAKKGEIAKLVKELGLKPKRIKELVEVVIQGEDSITLRVDTLYYPSSPDEPTRPIPYVYEDKWNRFEAFLDGDEIGLVYAITDSISIVTTKEKGGYKIQALSSNPAIRITGLSEIKVNEKKKKRWWVVPTTVIAGVLIGAKVF
jgi:uncharacterized lipoprotein YehR (DUF1307 family)